MMYLVSACLLGCNCKYSGGNNLNSAVQRFLADRDYIEICPEVEGGLPTPRTASEIVPGSGQDVLSGKAKVLTKSGQDVTAQFLKGAELAVQVAKDSGSIAAILKERSPSCGVHYIYSGDFTGTVVPGQGVAAAALAKSGLLLFTEETIGEGMELDYNIVTEKIVNWLKEKVEAAGAKGCMVGLSGGIDSAVVAALCQRAFPKTTKAVILPVESSSQDVEHGWMVAKKLGLDAQEINMDKVFHSFLEAAGEAKGLPTDLAVANVKPRLRMTMLYYLAAKHNYLVIGTGNKSELVTGFFTKFGDGGVDLEPIGELVKEQVYELARHLDIPVEIIHKAPTAGLWPGQTDEDEFGFTYKQLDQYILTGTTDSEVVDRIEQVIRRARHKAEMPPVCPL